ncbi:MAG: peptidylprolyl isomerase [Candidatus Fermentibacteria bacterium]|nr:peptidylprolyl isomerase [Candidatus Fermentibacteria bacterium]
MINILLCLTVLISSPMTLERVIAVVGSEPVLHSDVVSLLIESGIDQETAYNIDPSSSSYQLAVEQIIEEKLLVEAARREGLYPDRQQIEDAVDQAMNDARSEFSTEAEFMDYLSSIGMTVVSLTDSYSSVMGDKIASENYVRFKAGTIMSSLPSDAAAFLAENPESVTEVLTPSNISWIYLPVLPSGTEEASEMLSEIRADIEAGETTFSSAAATYSQDGSASSGGDLGWFSRGDMTSAFEGVVYSLEPGEIAGPFLTPFGVHLVKLTDKDEERVRASHIIIIVELEVADLDSTTRHAEEIVSELEAGLDFAEAVNQFSYDPDPDNENGFLGTVNIGAWEGTMRESVIHLNPGEVSEPVAVEQNMAVAIFRMNEDQSINWEDYSAEELNSMVQSVYWQSYYSGMIESLRSDLPVVMNI